jgi:hypothetical protein
MGWVQPDRHRIADPELDDFYRRDADAEDKALAHAASRQPTTAAPSGPPQTPSPSSSGASEGPGLNDQLRAIDVHLTDWLEADVLEPHEALKARQLRADVRSRLRRDERYVNRKTA